MSVLQSWKNPPSSSPPQLQLCPRRQPIWEEPCRQLGPGTAPSTGNPQICHLSILSDQVAVGLLCLVDHGHWEIHKPFLTQDHSAEAETPVCLQRMKICFLGEVKEKCALKILKGFCFLLAQRRPQIPSGPAREKGLVGPIQEAAYSVNFWVGPKDPGIPPVHNLGEDRDLRDGYPT